MAKENAGWGYTRIVGAMKNLGHDVGRMTVARVLAEHGIDPAPAFLDADPGSPAGQNRSCFGSVVF